MVKADYVPSPLRAPITGGGLNPSTKRRSAHRRFFVDHANTDSLSVSSNTWAFCYATAALLLGWWPWNVLLILVLFLYRGSRRGSSI
jgi:hypothetical protein